METGELLSVGPMELQFPFELNKPISCTMQLTNKTDKRVAFKVKTTNPKKYFVRPNTGFVLPCSTCDVVVTMQAQNQASPDMQCKDKFLLQSVVASSGTGPKDITSEMFNKESGNLVEECKLRATYVSPPRSPYPIQQQLEEVLSPGASVLDDRSLNNTNFTFEKTPVVRLIQERDSFIQQNTKLRQELESLRREAKRSQGGVPLMYAMIVGLVAVLLGYLIKRT